MAGVGFDWQSRRILIVDRDDQFRFWARGLFKQQRVRELRTVSALAEAPAALRCDHFDAVLAELDHVHGEALRFLNWLRDSKASPCPDLAVLLMVKTREDEQVAKSGAFSIHDVLTKPISGAHMLQRVAEVLTSPRLLVSTRPQARPQPIRGAAPVIADPSPRQDTAGEGMPGGAMPGRAPSAPSVEAPAGAMRPRNGGASLPAKATGAGSRLSAPSAPGPVVRAGSRLPIATDVPKGPGEPSLFDPDLPARKKGSEGWPDDDPPANNSGRTGSRGGIEVLEAPPRRSQAASDGGRSIDDLLAAHARWAESRGKDGERGNFEGRDLSFRDLRQAMLDSAMMRRADLSGCDFAEAQLQGADLRYAELMGAKLTGANLAVARLRHARLCGCILESANLKGADMAGANLSGAKLGDADMAGANLLGVELAGADLSAVRGLIQGQLERVRGDSKTRLPPGLFLPATDDGR